jgi:NAD(P)-dependent dehydrogenase (short-subunit alcohol dehydrogenase family)
LDVTVPAMVAAAARRVLDEAGQIDCLINNAAILGPMDRGAAEALDFDAIRQVIEVNAIGTLRVIEAFWPLLERGQTRLIANISSEAGSVGQCWRDGWFGYGMSKAALNMLSAQFHNAIRPKGGRVMVLHPGWVRTWMQGKLDSQADLSPEESAADLIRLLDARGAESHERPLFLDHAGKLLPW